MNIETRKVGNVVIFTIVGDIVFNHLNEIREIIKKGISEADTTKFLIDLSKVGVIDSAGVGFIVSVYKTVLFQKGSFSLINPNEVVKNVLETVGLTRLFKIYDSEDEAIKAI
ncbi:MAG: STAS domain-containing protein [Nitrospinota bacterium]